ncbi:hypothetical protein Gorai_016145, partial [Gossypium raimondii]|nr:hypothetical protein [Gossypium raimondii]
VSPGVVDLVEKLLVFDLSKATIEPTCPSPFIVNFEQTKSNKDNIKELVWKESWKFNQDIMVE